ncbi:hypothetical protein FOXYSP1_10230 [Fusarium oxysporum f. sp. phaseoli]
MNIQEAITEKVEAWGLLVVAEPANILEGLNKTVSEVGLVCQLASPENKAVVDIVSRSNVDLNFVATIAICEAKCAMGTPEVPTSSFTRVLFDESGLLDDIRAT